MPSEVIAVIFLHEQCTDEAYPVVRLRLQKHIPELMAEVLEGAGFFVDLDKVEPILKVSAWQHTDKAAMVQRIIIALTGWNAQYCGFTKKDRTLQIYSNLAGFGNPSFGPPPLGSPMRCIGELSAELNQAVKLQEYEEAARLKSRIEHIREDMRRITLRRARFTEA